MALYDVVEAAEELDLEEQARDEASWAELTTLQNWPSDEADEPVDVAEAVEEDPNEATHVTMSQAVGLIEHLLGGRPMGDGGRSAS